MDVTKTLSDNDLIFTKPSERNKRMDLLHDDEISQLYFDRNEQAIAETEKKYGKYLKKIAADMTDDRRDAEECVNDVYLSAWNSIPPNRPASLKAYLTVLIRRAAADVFRKDGRNKRIPKKLYSPLEELADVIFDDVTENELDNRGLSDAINSFVSQLSDRQKYIFISRYYVNRQVNEIAKKLNVSRSTVAKDLTEMKKSLKQWLDKEGYYI